MHIVSSDPAVKFKPIVYRGQNTIKEFILKMKEIEEMLMPLIKAVEPMVMTAVDKHDFKCAKTCCLCKKPLGILASAGAWRLHPHSALTPNVRRQKLRI